MSGESTVTRVWRLSAAAEQVGLSPRHVRRYVRLGLLRPLRVEGREWWFGEAELARLRRIRRLAALGFSAEHLVVVLRLADELAAARRALATYERGDDASSPGE
ncbi:MAG TPA: MerR family transcriptional regulator [Chloroflexota bacterium]|nr:MerR family transcriptional regulator [Chloroflexota bacterium]